MTSTLLILGGSIFVLLGIVHGVLTIIDIYRPKQFAPMDDSVRIAMKSTGVGFSRGHADMWDAWLGFNISHSVGLVLFGAASIWLAMNLTTYNDLVRPGFVILVAVSLVYLVLSLRFWFHVPTVSFAIATACFAVAWWSY